MEPPPGTGRETADDGGESDGPAPKRTKDQRQGKQKSRKPNTMGRRCVIFGCDNTTYTGYSIYELPKTEGETRRRWIRFINNCVAHFCATDRKCIMICSGHFTHDSFDQSQLQMYRRGLRKIPPRLQPSAVPSIKKPVQPFPPEWFIKPETATDTIEGREMDEATTSSSSSDVTPAMMPAVTPTVLDVGSTSDDRSARKKRRSEGYLSSYARKKEIARMEDTLKQREKEELEKEQARKQRETEKAIQFSPVLVSRKSQYMRIRRKTCGLQVRPRTSVKGTQTDIVLQEPTKEDRVVHNVCTQTKPMSTIPVSEAEEDLDDDGDEEVDDEVADPTYEPDKDEADNEDQDDDAVFLDIPDDVQMETKYIVFESCLMELFKHCRKCGLLCDVQKVHPQGYGSQLKILSVCSSCEESSSWYSQPMVRNIPAGNILLTSSILFAGASPSKVLKVLSHLNLQAISMSTFLEHQSQYLQPAVVRVWKREQRSLTNSVVAEGRKLVIGGDGRSDSPGHSAKYGSYTFMDMESSKIIDVQLVQSNEVKNSNAMELEGLRRGLALLDQAGVDVKTLITDRHMQVAKWMRETYPDVDHRYDVWHIAKGVKKKIKAVAKLKECEMAGEWKRSIVNHVYYCAISTPDGNPETITKKFKCLLDHIRNVHKDCAHGEEYPAREWLKAGTKVYEKLSEILLQTRLLKDLGKMSPMQQTSDVESFHSVILHWCPKMLAYSYPGMKCRLYLAALHWNENGKRQQATKQDGTPIFKISYPKAKEGGYTVSKVLTGCTYSYVSALMSEVLLLVNTGQKLRPDLEELQPKPALCSKYDHPDKAEAVRLHQAHHRFAT